MATLIARRLGLCAMSGLIFVNLVIPEMLVKLLSCTGKLYVFGQAAKPARRDCRKPLTRTFTGSGTSRTRPAPSPDPLDVYGGNGWKRSRLR
jgi:hypothetical protein